MRSEELPVGERDDSQTYVDVRYDVLDELALVRVGYTPVDARYVRQLLCRRATSCIGVAP